MLVLSRKKNQSIVIGDDIVIVINDIRKDRVSIGIDAPKDVPIRRVELSPDAEVVKRHSP